MFFIELFSTHSVVNCHFISQALACLGKVGGILKYYIYSVEIRDVTNIRFGIRYSDYSAVFCYSGVFGIKFSAK